VIKEANKSVILSTNEEKTARESVLRKAKNFNSDNIIAKTTLATTADCLR
jgi:hypothetical protein